MRKLKRRPVIRKKTARVKKEIKAKEKDKLPADFYRVAEELTHIKENKKALEEREKELKEKLGDYLEEYCYKDTKGSFLTKIEIDGKEKVIKKECRKRPKLNEEKAEEYFREHKLWDFVSEKKEVINPDYVEQAVLQGKMPAEDLESITDMGVSYALVIKDYKPEDEEEGII